MHSLYYFRDCYLSRKITVLENQAKVIENSQFIMCGVARGF